MGLPTKDPRHPAVKEAAALADRGVGTSVLFLEVLNQVEVDTKAEGTVDDLSHESSINSLVEFLDATVLVDLLGDIDGVGVTSSLSSELKADLDHIHRLDEGGGSAGCHGTSQEVEIEIHTS